ncbi:MAG: hypothetical protein HQM08_00790 [Candidatus Riflebacteria bacterium]|nr:hypothetical protein [Candidatus Riflebacteria bacterium]
MNLKMNNFLSVVSNTLNLRQKVCSTTLLLTLIFIWVFLLSVPSQAQFQPLLSKERAGNTDFDGYEIYTIGKADRPKGETSRILPEGTRHALNEDGLIGFFVSETADRIQPHRMFSGARLNYVDITSSKGKALYTAESGTIDTLALSMNFIGDWAEWAVTVPVQYFTINAPRTYGRAAADDTGLGNIKLAWKATYLPDHSYYRCAYGAVINATTGDPGSMWPTSTPDDELKVFGCVTTRETDFAVGNLELGSVVDSKGLNNRFLYRFGLSYEATIHATLIGELVGDIYGGNDKDTMDLVMGIRLAPSKTAVLEFQFTKNLRTYRDFGWDQRLGAGVTVRW